MKTVLRDNIFAFLTELLVSPCLRVTMNSVTWCQFSPKDGSVPALNSRLILGLYNRSTEIEKH